MRRFFTLAVLALLPLMAMAQPKVVGHRGCRFEGPFENTLASMKVALDAGVDAIEFDINLTSDEAAERTDIMQQVNTYAKEMEFKFITGAESLDNYDNYLKELEALNIDRAIEITQGAVDRFNGK